MATGKKGTKKRREKLWNATVDIPRGAAVDDAPPLILKYLGRTLATETLDGLDGAGIQPARTFTGKTKKRNRPTRPFLYNQGRHVIVESQTEAVEAHLLDRDPSVEWVIPQGIWVKCLVQPVDRPDASPRWAWSCVDFLVQRKDGTFTGIEVKRSTIRFKPRPVVKLLATADACRQVGFDYEVRAGLSRLEGMVFRQLHHARRTHYLSHPEHQQLRRRMIDAATAGPVTFAELRDLGTPTVSAMLVWELLWHEMLCFDWTTPIELGTPIRLHGTACREAGGSSAWAFRCGPRRVDLVPQMREWAASL